MVQRSQHARRVLDLAKNEAAALGHRYLGPEHLVLGVLRDGGSGAARVLRAQDVDLEAARRTIGARLGRCWRRSGSTWTSCGTPLQR